METILVSKPDENSSYRKNTGCSFTRWRSTLSSAIIPIIPIILTHS